MEESDRKHISFGSIEQFRHCVFRLRQRVAIMGIPTPTLSFHGTVKLHGTNASVVFDPLTRDMYAQSRSLVITPKNDNAGFAQFFEKQKKAFEPLFAQALSMSETIDTLRVVIFGEWCGGRIQTGVALQSLPNQFVIFAVGFVTKFGEGDKVDTCSWLTPHELEKLTVASEYAHLIRNIQHFQTWDVEVDFNKPEIAQNIFVHLTEEVEKECPFGKANGVSGTGEGIVWTCVRRSTDPEMRIDDLTFKTKGEKHVDTKVKVIVQVSPEKSDSIRQFAEAVVTDNRLEKMLDKIREQGRNPLDIKNTGIFVKLVREDVQKEEADLLEASGFALKDAVGEITSLSRQWYMNRLNKV